MISLTVKEKESYFKQEVCHICKKNIADIDNSSEIMVMNYRRVKDHCCYTKYMQYENICYLKYKTPKKILLVFHNSSTMTIIL